MAKTKTITINLARHGCENRYLMCWYTIQIPGQRTLQFRSDKFVPENVEEKLHDLHCTIGNPNKLIRACLTLMMPYLQEVTQAAIAYLKKYPKPKEDTGFQFDSDPIEEYVLEDLT